MFPLLGCSSTADREPSPEPVATDTAANAYLPRPFTADQIRDAWSEGLTLRIRQTTPDDAQLQQWTVVATDEDGAEIEYAIVDASGNVLPEPRVERSSWLELRDHATFATETATRERVSRETSLGLHEGWLYVNEDPETGTVTEFFFADAFPGAPVWARTARDGELVVEMEQLDRRTR
jgi:hypothetical protein